ncbi:MAG: pyrroline-5-carboxylate reductase [Verrucomicrobiota bacterium]
MKIGVIGCGKMGTALIEGAIRSGVVAAADVIGVDPWQGARDQFAKATGGARVATDLAALAHCDVVLLCTKPLNAVAVLRDVSQARAGQPITTDGHRPPLQPDGQPLQPDGSPLQPALIISIAAGITLAVLEAAASPALRVIRAMPNTPALVGRGAAGFCLGIRATPEDAATARLLLDSVGVAIEVPERLMDAVTGLSGSGPAYVYLMIEALADGGVLAGLPRADAIRLAAQTVAGAAAMVIETGEHPAVLKDMVTSPGGTTIAGLAVLEAHGVRSALIEAVGTAARRATELGK